MNLSGANIIAISNLSLAVAVSVEVCGVVYRLVPEGRL